MNCASQYAANWNIAITAYTFVLIKMNNECNWAILENNVTKTHGEKTAVKD